MTGDGASRAGGWLVAGKGAYGVTHALPLADAYRRRHGEAMPFWSDGAAAPLPRGMITAVNGWQVLRSGAPVLCLDIPTLVRFGLAARRCGFLYHALIGKGALHRAGRPHAALRLGEILLFPEAEQFALFPERLRTRCRACGHLPEDWLSLPESLLPEATRRTLAIWRAAPKPRILLLATRGRFSAWASLRAILTDPPSRVTLGVKRHPALPQVTLPAKVIDLADVPVPLLAAAAQLVVGDHSSATLEALRLGRPVAIIETDALRAFAAGDPGQAELGYLGRLPKLGSAAALRALLAAPARWPVEGLPVGNRRCAGDRVLDLLQERGW